MLAAYRANDGSPPIVKARQLSDGNWEVHYPGMENSIIWPDDEFQRVYTRVVDLV